MKISYLERQDQLIFISFSEIRICNHTRSKDMKELLKKSTDNRRKYQNILMDTISLFSYRDQRYANHFSIILIYGHL